MLETGAEGRAGNQTKKQGVGKASGNGRPRYLEGKAENAAWMS